MRLSYDVATDSLYIHLTDMPEGTLRAILRQAGIDPEIFVTKYGFDFEFEHAPFNLSG